MRKASERTQHSIEVESMGRRVVIAIGLDDEAGAFEQRAMVFPTRIADVDLGTRREPAQKVRADLQPAGTAQRLQRDGPAGRDDLVFRAEDKRLYRLVIRGDAIDRQVTTGRD